MREVGVLFLLAAVLLCTSPGDFWALTLAVAVHEAGHTLFLLLLGEPIRSLRWEGRGFSLEYAGVSGVLGQWLAAAAGPMAGFAYALAASCWGQRLHADWLCLSSGLSFLLSLFNLLPIPPLDGGRMLSLAAGALLGMRRAERFCRLTGLGLTALLGACGLWLLLRGSGPALLLASLYLLPEQLRQQWPQTK